MTDGYKQNICGPTLILFQVGKLQFLRHNKLINKERNRMMKKLINFLKDEEGATAVEYGLMVALIAAVIVAIVNTLGQNVNTAFKIVSDNVAAS